MYATKKLSVFKANPEESSQPPPEGPSSGYLAVKENIFWGQCWRRTVRNNLPIPHNKFLEIDYNSSGWDSIYTARMLFVPVLKLPLSANRYYAVVAEGYYKGYAEQSGEPYVLVIQYQLALFKWHDRLSVSRVSRLKHDNFIEMVGYCCEENNRILAYEFATLGSLHDILHGKKGVNGAQPGPPLDWMQRVKIAVDAAKGLKFLHDKVQPSMIHGGIRSSNILLFDEFKAKIADFNPSNHSPDTAAWLHSTKVLGSFVYYAPEYAMTGRMTQKCDVYSFGVVLLELLTGRKPVDHSMPKGQQSLVMWAAPKLSTDRIIEIIDPRLEGRYPPDDLAKMAAVAALCVHCDVQFRPSIRTVVRRLSPLLSHEPASHNTDA